MSSEHVDVTDVNVIHVLYEYICHCLYTRMRAWVYVYLPGSGAPDSASARRRGAATVLGQPFLEPVKPIILSLTRERECLLKGEPHQEGK